MAITMRLSAFSPAVFTARVKGSCRDANMALTARADIVLLDSRIIGMASMKAWSQSTPGSVTRVWMYFT